MKTKITLLLATLLCLFYACREKEHISFLLHEVDELTNTHPDSALTMLNGIASEISSCPVSQRMHYELLRAKAQNKAYVDFTTDSIMLEVTDYYDHNGTANERMMAHYLLGCCYRDMGEAPATIECYKDAVNQADTTRQDCDFRTLMSIYGQMATLYDQQVMPTEELEALERSGWYALKCGDTINYIRSIQLESHAYDLMQDSMKVFESINRSRDLFLYYGYVREAAQALPRAISLHLDNKKYSEANTLMQIYESQSGRFDEDGNISPRYSHYYNSKGLYYLGVHKLDLAEHYFRRLMLAGYHYDACCGLSEVYRELGITDSVLHYRKLADEALDLRFTDISKQSVRQAESVYNYTRNQRIAHEKELEAVKSHTIMLCISMVFIILFGCSFYLYHKQKIQKETKIKEMMQEYLDLSNNYEKSMEEAKLIQHSLADLASFKQKEVEELKDKLEHAYDQFKDFDQKEKQRALLKSRIVVAFRNLAIPQPKQKFATQKQWTELSNAIKNTMPFFYMKISAGGLLSNQEYHIVILTRLGFTVGEISVLLGTTSQRITNAKRSANFKLFGVDNAQTLIGNISKL